MGYQMVTCPKGAVRQYGWLS